MRFLGLIFFLSMFVVRPVWADGSSSLPQDPDPDNDAYYYDIDMGSSETSLPAEQVQPQVDVNCVAVDSPIVTRTPFSGPWKFGPAQLGKVAAEGINATGNFVYKARVLFEGQYYWPRKMLRPEINAQLNKGDIKYSRCEGNQIAASSKQVVNTIQSLYGPHLAGPQGSCYVGVDSALAHWVNSADTAPLTSTVAGSISYSHPTCTFLASGSAMTATKSLQTPKGRQYFKEIIGVLPQDLPAISYHVPGAIEVWDSVPGKHPDGHVAIMDGKGNQLSDASYAQGTSPWADGSKSTVHIFVPIARNDRSCF